MLKKVHLQQLLIFVRSSLWFVPSLLILTAIGLALSLVEIDRYFYKDLRALWPRVFDTEAEGARGMLSAIASSMATVAGVVFSITIVALALASSQYTSRILRNFMRDRSTQTVLGVFVGVYIYCLLVLRTVSGDSNIFVPSLAVLGAVVLAVVGIGFFIYFIHHISSSIQASEIIKTVTEETLQAMGKLYSADMEDDADHIKFADNFSDAAWQNIPASRIGYIQTVDSDGLRAFARKHAVIIRMEVGVGEFIASGRPLVAISGTTRMDEIAIREINNFYAVASYRTIDQDAAFGIRQLVDIALKALSPSINDTTTAITCIDHLSALLSFCSTRRISPVFSATETEPGVIAKTPDFEDLVNLSYRQILANAEGNVEVMVRLLDSLTHIASQAKCGKQWAILDQWVSEIEEAAARSVKQASALGRLRENVISARLAMRIPPASITGTKHADLGRI
ncbi:DUF2254 domain-containing protein [Noviherbaspirillum sp.]|uniref:DUF2254 domain-containing protein n=1 Tax=Noviherbaspirillum sp. TaxID=1926288 RepID=UPI002FE23417